MDFQIDWISSKLRYLSIIDLSIDPDLSQGGIEDDLIVSKTDKDFLYLVTNAGCIDKDLPYLQVSTVVGVR